MAGSPTVTVVIVNWNGRSWLQQCLPALAAQTFTDFSIVIVDNGSTDDSVTWLTENWPEITLLPQKENLGFAAANNIGILAAASPFVALLNNDTLAAPHWLAALVTAVSAPDIGSVASCIVQWDRPDLLDSAGIIVDRAGIAWNRGWNQPASQAAAACDVFGPSAAAALYRREMLGKIGLFDEAYFAYYEDVDLAWRAQRAGWRCRYEPDAYVKHWHSATSRRTPHFKNRLLGRNKIWTILKNYVWPDLLWAAPAILVYDVTAALFQTARTRNLSPVYGRLQALKQIRNVWARRTPTKTKPTLAPWPLPGRQIHLPPP